MGAAAVVVVLGVASAIFEGIRLSFLIPLAGLATGAGMDTTIPVIGPLLGWLDARVGLAPIHILLLVVGFFFSASSWAISISSFPICSRCASPTG